MPVKEHPRPGTRVHEESFDHSSDRGGRPSPDSDDLAILHLHFDYLGASNGVERARQITGED